MYAAAAAVVAMRRENESITSRKEGGTSSGVWEKEAGRGGMGCTYLRHEEFLFRGGTVVSISMQPFYNVL